MFVSSEHFWQTESDIQEPKMKCPFPPCSSDSPGDSNRADKTTVRAVSPLCTNLQFRHSMPIRLAVMVPVSLVSAPCVSICLHVFRMSSSFS